ncbi:type II secretion system F family protein [Thalassobacillus devorans]|uniref:type II secretion system F family protein n=1 Tax=Thalassobacillus devorans TaxID=279813 RepID=UPI000A1CBCFF|nr:type II secretion system F family protein [Thalassobacillus devorans]
MLFIYISFFLFSFLLTYALAALRAEKKWLVKRRIDDFITAPAGVGGEMETEDPSFYKRIVAPEWKKLKRRYQRRLGREKASKLELKLLQAGEPFGFTPVEFKIFQLVLVSFFFLIGAAAGMLAGTSLAFIILFAVLGAGIITVLLNHFLKARALKRSKTAVKELPDTLDLLTISLEGGLGFDAALSKVVARKRGVLSDEFKVCLEEIRLGKTRKEALNGINQRLDAEELKSLIYNIVQAEKLGIGMVSVLRVQTEDIREQRKQRAEEAAMKAPIKMMFPLVLFIFPTLFIILLGPAILQFLDAFK